LPEKVVRRGDLVVGDVDESSIPRCAALIHLKGREGMDIQNLESPERIQEPICKVKKKEITRPGRQVCRWWEGWEGTTGRGTLGRICKPTHKINNRQR
jgi:hypothetical protein